MLRRIEALVVLLPAVTAAFRRQAVPALVRGLASIDELHLGFTKITDDSLQKLSRARTLRLLSVGGTKVTDAGVKMVSEHKGLIRLELGDTVVTDACIDDIAKLTELESLSLAGTKITEDGMKKLRRALPNAQIYP